VSFREDNHGWLCERRVDNEMITSVTKINVYVIHEGNVAHHADKNLEYII
jgi:hypothetical protein